MSQVSSPRRPSSVASTRPDSPADMRIDVGLLSLGFGLLFPYQIGVVDGLFSTTPRWGSH
jgi:hypothetical protein